MNEDEIFDRGASLSYYFIFALFPTLLFLTALFGMLPIPDLVDRMMAYVEQMLPGDAASMIQKTVAEKARAVGSCRSASWVPCGRRGPGSRR